MGPGQRQRWGQCALADGVARGRAGPATRDEGVGSRLRAGVVVHLSSARRATRIDKPASFRHKYHTEGHTSAEEAEACYRDFLLDQELTFNHKSGDAQRKCEICEQWTQLYACIDMRIFNLCENHQNRESVEKLFNSISEIWSS